MIDQQMQRLAERVERLERENRRFEFGALGAALLVAAGAIMAATTPAPRVVTAHSFRVVDDQGRVRGAFGLEPSDFSAVALVLYDDHGRQALGLRDRGTPSFAMYDASGALRVHLSLAESRSAYLNGMTKLGLLKSPADRAAIRSTLAPGGTPSLQFYGNDADLEFDDSAAMPLPSVMVGSYKNGAGGVLISGAGFNERLSLGRNTLYLRAGGKLSLKPASWRRPSA